MWCYQIKQYVHYHLFLELCTVASTCGDIGGITSIASLCRSTRQTLSATMVERLAVWIWNNQFWHYFYLCFPFFYLYHIIYISIFLKATCKLVLFYVADSGHSHGRMLRNALNSSVKVRLENMYLYCHSNIVTVNYHYL